MDRSIILIIFLDLLEESIFEDSSQLPPDNSFRWDSARRLQRGISGDPAVILAHFCFVLMLLDSSIIPCSVMHRTRSSMTEFRAQFRQFRVPPSPPPTSSLLPYRHIIHERHNFLPICIFQTTQVAPLSE